MATMDLKIFAEKVMAANAEVTSKLEVLVDAINGLPVDRISHRWAGEIVDSFAQKGASEASPTPTNTTATPAASPATKSGSSAA